MWLSLIDIAFSIYSILIYPRILDRDIYENIRNYSLRCILDNNKIDIVRRLPSLLIETFDLKSNYNTVYHRALCRYDLFREK